MSSKRRVKVSILLIFVLSINLFYSFPMSKAARTDHGVFQSGVTWDYSNGELSFSGCGALPSYAVKKAVGDEECENVKSVVVGAEINGVNICTTDGCNSLNTIIVSSGNLYYESKGNCCISKSDDTLMFGCPNSTIPEGVKKLYFGCFSQMKIGKMVIPHSVKNISCFAFGNSQVSSITVQSPEISLDELAFQDAYIGTMNTCGGDLRCDNNVITHKGRVIGFIGNQSSYEVSEGIERIYVQPSWKIAVSSISLPSTCKYIGDGCFFSSGIDIKIYAKTAPELGNRAFYDFSGTVHVSRKGTKGYEKWNVNVKYDLDGSSEEPSPVPVPIPTYEPTPTAKPIPTISPTPSVTDAPKPTPEVTSTPKPSNSPSKSSIGINDLSFGFENSAKDLEYVDDKCLSLSSFKVFFSDSAAEQYYSMYRQFNGVCFGFAAATDLYMIDKSDDLSLDEFNRSSIGELNIHDYSENKGMDVKRLLECLWVSQLTSRIQTEFYRHKNEYDTLLKMGQDSFDIGNAYVLCLFSSIYGGHAIVPYDVKVVDDRLTKLYVYDNNYSKQIRCVNLYTSGGHVTGFEYSFATGMTVSSKMGDWISYVDYNTISDVYSKRRREKINSAFVVLNKNEPLEIRNKVSGVVVGEQSDGEFTSNTRDVFECVPVGAQTEKTDKRLVYLPDEGSDFEIISTDNSILGITYCNGETVREYQTNRVRFGDSQRKKIKLCATFFKKAQRMVISIESHGVAASKILLSRSGDFNNKNVIKIKSKKKKILLNGNYKKYKYLKVVFSDGRSKVVSVKQKK